MDEALRKWVDEIIALDTGEELHLPTPDKKSATSLENQIKNTLYEMSSIHPEAAYSTRFTKRWKEGYYWVVCERTAVVPTVAFKKSQGEMSKIEIELSPERERQILMMMEDGHSKEEIEEILDPPLTEKERRIYFE